MTGDRPARLLASPAPREEWLALLAADPEALPFQHPDWTRAVVETSGGRDASRLYLLPSGARAVLPAIARPAGRIARALTLASQPFGWGMGGLVVAGSDFGPEDVRAVFADLATSGAFLTTLRPAPRRAAAYGAAAPGAAMSVPHTAHVLDLAGGFEAVWGARFTSKARRAVRKAQRVGVTVECDDSGRLVPVFDELYRRSVQRWAEEQHEPVWMARLRAQRNEPSRKFASVAAALGSACRLWVATVDGQPAAAIITLRQGDHAVYWRGAMDKDVAGPARANDLLHRSAIEHAISSGARYYHWGDSAPGSGLARFKESFGAAQISYEEYRLERLPFTRANTALRGAVKRVLRHRDQRTATPSAPQPDPD